MACSDVPCTNEQYCSTFATTRGLCKPCSDICQKVREDTYEDCKRECPKSAAYKSLFNTDAPAVTTVTLPEGQSEADSDTLNWAIPLAVLPVLVLAIIVIICLVRWYKRRPRNNAPTPNGIEMNNVAQPEVAQPDSATGHRHADHQDGANGSAVQAADSEEKMPNGSGVPAASASDAARAECLPLLNKQPASAVEQGAAALDDDADQTRPKLQLDDYNETDQTRLKLFEDNIPTVIGRPSEADTPGPIVIGDRSYSPTLVHGRPL